VAGARSEKENFAVESNALSREIRAFVVETFLLGQDNGQLANSASLLGERILDSTGILEVVTFLEEKYGVKVEDEEMTADNLDSIDKLVGFVQKKKLAQPSLR
jgi:acyl carrier protein